MQFFNTQSQKKEIFEPLTPGRVRMYSCGPTVWDYAHIGNFRSFVLADLLKRYLRYRGYEVFHVMNITDIEDKILRRVRQEGIALRELTEKYTGIFFRDLESLNVEPAEVYPRATHHVEEMVQMVSRLIDKGLAYEREGSVYYSISQFPDYGKFARLDLSGMQDGVRVDTDEYDKEHVRDFVLWKAWVESDGKVYWDSPFGRGRPGWHLECSCMSMKYLGESFDLHTGGVDLVFPHHQNEIAQSEGLSGRPFVRYWMHNAFVNINDEKMSKSRGKFYRLRDIARTPEEIRACRYMLVASHYRRAMNFTFEALEAHRRELRRLVRLRERLGAIQAHRSGENWEERVVRARAGFRESLDDDLNTPQARAAIFGLVNAVEKALNQDRLGGAAAAAVLGFLDEVDQVLGIFYRLEGEEEHPAELPRELARLLEEREAARTQKNWARADQLRARLAAAGVAVRDTREGMEWSWMD